MAQKKNVRKVLAAQKKNRDKKRRRQLRCEELEARRVLATFTVNDFGDTVDATPGNGVAADASGNTTLRAAIMEANALPGPDIIRLPNGVYNLSLSDSGGDLDDSTGDLDITDNLTIVRNGPADEPVVNASLLEYGGRVFEIAAGVNAAIIGLTITGGNDNTGGGVQNLGSLQLLDVKVTGNSADGFTAAGGGVFNAAGAELTITDSEITNNHTFGKYSAEGGGIYNEGGFAPLSDESNESPQPQIGGLGGILTLNNSLVDDNSASAVALSQFGGLALGGGVWNGGTAVINDSTIGDPEVGFETGNTAGAKYAAEGGGIYNGGSTVEEQTASLTVTRSRVLGNIASTSFGPPAIQEGPSPQIGFRGAGLGGGVWNNGTAHISDSEISDNVAEGSFFAAGGGVYNTRPDQPDAVIGQLNGDASPGSMTLLRTMVGNNTAGAYGTAEGGGVWNDGDVEFADGDIEGNEAIANSEYGGALGGGVYNGGVNGDYGGTSATFELTLSRVLNNTAAGYDAVGGGIYNGGIVPSGDLLTLLDTTVEGNLAAGSGDYGGGFGGGIWNSASAEIQRSTISDNHATGEVVAEGGGLWNGGDSAIANLENSTVSMNSAEVGGGIHQCVGGEVNLRYSTIAANEADDGGGVFVDAEVGLVTLKGTIVADHESGGDISGDVTSFGHNFVEQGSLSGEGDLGGGDPILGPLQNNGGPTFTHALGLGSPAIDAADPDSHPLTDQRGVERPVNGDEMGDSDPDIGAYEFVPTPDPPEIVSIKVLGSAWVAPAYELTDSQPDGMADVILPFINLNQVQATFSRDVVVATDSLVLSGVLSGVLTPISVGYDPATFTATWTFGANLGRDIYLFDFQGHASDTNPIEANAADEGLLNGGSDHELLVRLLPGDVTGNGIVNNQDVARARNQWLTVNPDAPTDDVNGDGLMNQVDYQAVASRQFGAQATLPSGTPANDPDPDDIDFLMALLDDEGEDEE